VNPPLYVWSVVTPETDAVTTSVRRAQTCPFRFPEHAYTRAFEKAAAGGVPVYDIKDERAARAWNAYEAVGKEITNG
jgi:hypothetical protein